MAKKRVTRRDFLTMSAVTAAGAALAACQRATPTTAPEPTQVAAPTEPAAPTTAPEPTAASGTEPTAAPVSEYKEAPAFAEQVAGGNLPPVEERLPKNPRVVKPVHEIGQYGGTWRMAYKGVSDRWGIEKVAADGGLLAWDMPEGGEISVVADAADSYEVSEDGTEYTWHIREGLRWSDGVPVTTEDVRFFYEDLYDVTNSGWGKGDIEINGKKMELEIVDDYTFKTKFGGPNPFLPLTLARGGQEGGSHGPNFMTASHYFKKYHPKYGKQEDIDKALEDKGLTSWEQLFDTGSQFAWFWYNPEVPVIHPWVTKVAPPADRATLERNPYCFHVDPEGNQLPYIDEMAFTYFEEAEALNFMLIKGEIDCQVRHVDPGSYALYKDNEEKGGYRVLRWISASTYSYRFDVAYAEKDPALGELLMDLRFRQAVSVALNRDEMNELVFNGLLEVRQACPVTGSPQFDPDWEQYYTQYDPDLANQLLDEMSLTERDAEGYRLRKDGERVSLLLEYATVSFAGPDQLHQLTQDYLKAVGIEVLLRPVERSLFEENESSNDVMFSPWVCDRSAVVPADPINYIATNYYGDWYSTKGQTGGEPPAGHPFLKIMDLWDQAKAEPDDAKREAIMKEALDLWKEGLWRIGIAGEPIAPLITTNRMQNVPEGLIEDDPLRSLRLANPQQFFIKE